jgi:hypothetical protein
MENTLCGYALVDGEQRGFSWHRTFEDACERAAWEALHGCGKFRVVKDSEAVWPDCYA